MESVSTIRQRADLCALTVAIVLLHQSTHSTEAFPRLLYTLLNETKTLGLIRFIDLASFIFLVTIVLDLLAFVLDLGEAECC